MADHYFSPAPQSEHNPSRFTTAYRGHTLLFDTDSGVFSRLALDRGTAILLDALPVPVSGDVLDMGCGYGALGVSLAAANSGARLTMADINERAVALAQHNARQNGVAAEALLSDGFAALAGRTFDWVVTNPPIRAGKRVLYRMFADGACALRAGGAMVLVIRKQQGAPSAKAYLETLYRQVTLLAREAGYWVLRCAEPFPRAVTANNMDESD
jgi:16S rRNA (guanine1207-N2)-methyltransferase